MTLLVSRKQVDATSRQVGHLSKPRSHDIAEKMDAWKLALKRLRSCATKSVCLGLDWIDCGVLVFPSLYTYIWWGLGPGRKVVGINPKFSREVNGSLRRNLTPLLREKLPELLNSKLFACHNFSDIGSMENSEENWKKFWLFQTPWVIMEAAVDDGNVEKF